MKSSLLGRVKRLEKQSTYNKNWEVLWIWDWEKVDQVIDDAYGEEGIPKNKELLCVGFQNPKKQIIDHEISKYR